MDVDGEVGWETKDGVTAENVESNTSDEVLVGI